MTDEERARGHVMHAQAIIKDLLDRWSDIDKAVRLDMLSNIGIHIRIAQSNTFPFVKEPT